MLFRAFAVVAILLHCGMAVGQERLVLFGGGNLVSSAVTKFLAWAKPPTKSDQLKILVVTWNASEPDRCFTIEKKIFDQAFLDLGQSLEPASIQMAVRLTQLMVNDEGQAAAAKDFFLTELRDATAVFFSGGDQKFTRDVIVRHPEIASALMAKYRAGVVYGGTSAGTAIMSDPMLWAPDAQPELYTTMKGLGLLPPDIMVDQHFFAREIRLARLKASLLKHHLPYGLGVDEDGAVTVTDGRFVTVHGGERAMILLNFEDSTADKITEIILKPGDSYELTHRKTK